MICVCRGWSGWAVEFQPWLCSFWPDRSSRWWLWAGLVAHRWSRAQLKVLPQVDVTPVPEHWPTWKAQERKEEKFTWKTYPIPSKGPAGCYLYPPLHRQGKFPWENKACRTFGDGADRLKRKKCLSTLLKALLIGYSCKSLTPRAQIRGWLTQL